MLNEPSPDQVTHAPVPVPPRRGRRDRHHAAAGTEKPDISIICIIDDYFARRISTNPRPNPQIELLKRLLNSELKVVSRRNVIAERRFSRSARICLASSTTSAITWQHRSPQG